jgi:hypothetical protein
MKDIFQILRALGVYYILYVEFSDFYVNQSLAGQTIPRESRLDRGS